MFLAKNGVVRALECVLFCEQRPGDWAELVHPPPPPPRPPPPQPNDTAKGVCTDLDELVTILEDIAQNLTTPPPIMAN